jgi:hypothetical protein
MSLGDCTVETKTIINTTTEVKIKWLDLPKLQPSLPTNKSW